MDLSLAGKVAIVTGAGRHIGRQIATTLAEEDAKVIVNDFFDDRAQSVAQEIRQCGGEAIGVKCDVTNRGEVDALVEKAVAEFGPVDILVNNAGIMPVEAVGVPSGRWFTETKPQDWDLPLSVNVYGVLNCTHAVLDGMCKQKYGKILTIMSDAGRIGEIEFVAYSAAKSSLSGFTKALAKEVGRFCVNVNCVSIGATPGDSIKEWLGKTEEEREKKLQSLIKLYPMGKGLKRLGLPTDVANAVAFMVSDAATWITGQILSVSGGYTMAD